MPASPSMNVIWLCMTAVLRKPLSDTRRPLGVSFSTRSPGLSGAAIALKAAADIVLSLILYLRLSLAANLPLKSDVRNIVCLASAVVTNGETLISSAITVCWTAHDGWEWNNESAGKAAPLLIQPRGSTLAVRVPDGLGEFHVSGRFVARSESGRDGTSSRVHASPQPRRKTLNYSNDYGMRNITSTVPQACPRSSGTAPDDSKSASRHE